MNHIIDILVSLMAIYIGAKVVKGIIKTIVFLALAAYLAYRFLL